MSDVLITSTNPVAMKSIFVLLTLVCFSIGEKERLSNLDLESLLKDSDIVSLLKRFNIDQDCDAMSGTVAVGKLWGKMEKKCAFNSSHSTIIKTKESLLNGAKFLKNLKSIACAQGCIEECCNLDGCDVAVYEEKDENNCYLFNCSKPNSCIFAPHALYRSIMVTSETDVSVDHAYVTSDQTQEKHETELQHLQSNNITPKSTQKPTTKKPTPPPVKNKVSLFAECSWWSECADPNAVCLTDHCECKDGYQARYGVCRQSCGDFFLECDNKGMNSTVPDCIYKRYQCDGIPQCADGSDEAGCDVDYPVDSYIHPKQSSKNQYYGPAAYQPIYPGKNAMNQLGFFGLPQRVSSQQRLPLSQSLNPIYSNPDISQTGDFRGQYYLPGYGNMDTQSGSYQSPWQLGPGSLPQSNDPIATGQQLYSQQSASSPTQNMPTQKSAGEVNDKSKHTSDEKGKLEIGNGFHAGSIEPTPRTYDGSGSNDHQKDENIHIAPAGNPVDPNVKAPSESEIQYKSRKPTTPPAQDTTESNNSNNPHDVEALEDETRGTKTDPDLGTEEDLNRYASSKESGSFDHEDVIDAGSRNHADIKPIMEVTTKTSLPIRTTESQIEATTRGVTLAPLRDSKILDNHGENVDRLQSWDGINDALSHQRKTNSESHGKMEVADSYTQSNTPQKASSETRKETQHKEKTKFDQTDGDRLYNFDRYKTFENVESDSPYYTGTNSHSRGQDRGPVRNTNTHRQHKYPYQENAGHKGRGHPRKEDYTDYYYQSPSEFDPFSTNPADFYDYGNLKTGIDITLQEEEKIHERISKPNIGSHATTALYPNSRYGGARYSGAPLKNPDKPQIEPPTHKNPHRKVKPSSSPVSKGKSSLVDTKMDSESFKNNIGKATTTVAGNDTEENIKARNYGMEEVVITSPTDGSQGPIVALSVGLAVTLLLLIIVGCRLRTVKRRLRKGKALHSNEADYLINGMYL
ncbi:hypothetical protein ACJMK2_038056 [Sinanodonta woodiana]|uniref:MANSC domain-containing protein n=1 Tax=Sinanodonta woodiana TaxID=1069815 RepID=A0ABD3WQV3_SINWO